MSDGITTDDTQSPQWTIKNSNTRNFIGNLRGDNTYSLKKQLSAAPAGGIFQNAAGDVDNKDIFPSDTNAIAGQGSTPFWGSYALYDTGVKFPFGIYYKDRKALQDVALAAMKAKTVDPKPFDMPAVEGAPTLEAAVNDNAVDQVHGLWSLAQQRGLTSLEQIKGDAELWPMYQRIVNNQKGDADITKQAEAAMLELEKEQTNPNATITPEDLQIRNMYRSINKDRAAYLLYGKGQPSNPEEKPIGIRGIQQMGASAHAITTMSKMASPYLDKVEDGVKTYFSTAKQEDGTPMPASKYAEFYANNVFSSKGTDANGRPVVGMDAIHKRAEDIAGDIEKEHPDIVGDKGQYYTSARIADMLTHLWRGKLQGMGITIDKRDMASKEAAIRNPDPQLINQVASDLTQGKPYYANADNYITPGTNGFTVHRKGAEDRFISPDDTGDVYRSIVSIAKEKSGALTQSDAQNLLAFSSDPSLEKNLSNILSTSKPLTQQNIKDYSLYEPVKLADKTIDIAGSIPYSNTSITKVTPGVDGSFSFSVNDNENGNIVPKTGTVIIPKDFMDARTNSSGRFGKLLGANPSIAVALADGSRLMQGKYSPVKDDSGKIVSYNIVNQDGTPIRDSGSNYELNVPANYVTPILTGHFGRISKTINSPLSNGNSGKRNESNSGVGHQPIGSWNANTKLITDRADKDAALAAAGFMNTSQYNGQTPAEVFKKFKSLTQAQRDEAKTHAKALTDEQLYNMFQ